MATTKDAPSLALDFVEVVEPRLWMSTSYKNTYVSSIPAAVLDVNNPGTGWYDLGSIRAVKIPVTKDVFEFKQGVPRTSRKQWEIDRSAQITFNTADLSPYVEAIIMGNTLYNTLGGAHARGAEGSHVASIYTDGTRRRTLIKTASLPAGEALARYDMVVCASPKVASIESSYNIAVVESWALKNATQGFLTLADAGFPIDPAVKDVIQKVDAVEFIDSMGSDTVRSAMLFWDTLVSSGTVKLQHCLYFPKIRNYSGGDFDLKDASEPYDVGVTLSAQATSMTFSDGSTGYNFYKKWVLQY